MKRAAILSSMFFLAAATMTRAETAEPDAGQQSPSQQAFLNLAEEEREKFAELVNETMRFFQQKRIFESLEKIHEAKKIFGESPELMNLEGSCYVEIRNFGRALDLYLRAEELAPDNPSIKFNIAEVLFVTKKWQESHDRFQALLPKVPPENIALTRLIEFKIMLTMLRLDRQDEAFILANKYDFLDDSPFHYYAQAALAFEAGDTLKAEEWMSISSRIFANPQVLAPWQDTLVEFGHIKGFFGDDAEADTGE